MLFETSTALEAAGDTIRQKLRASDILIVPGTVTAYANNPKWLFPEDQSSFDLFIQMAQHANTSFVYASSDIFHFEEFIREASTNLDFSEYSDPDTKENKEANALRKKLSGWVQHDGTIMSSDFSFIHNGVLHRLTLDTVWMQEFEEALLEQIDNTNARIEDYQQQPLIQTRGKIGEMANQLARHERYIRAKNDGNRTIIASELYPDLSYGEQERLIHTARYIFQEIVQNEIDEELMREAVSLADDGESNTSIAAMLGISRDRVQRLLYLDTKRIEN